MLTTVFLPSSAAAFIYFCQHHTQSGQSRVYRVMRLRTDCVHCRESVGTGPVVLKVVRVTGAAFASPWTKCYCAPLFSHTHYWYTVNMSKLLGVYKVYTYQNISMQPVLSACPFHTNSGCGKERRILIGPWWSAKAAPVRNYLEVYWPCAGGLSAANAIGTQLRDPINSGLTRWRMAVS